MEKIKKVEEIEKLLNNIAYLASECGDRLRELEKYEGQLYENRTELDSFGLIRAKILRDLERCFSVRKTVTILNTSTLTCAGKYEYKKINSSYAAAIVKEYNFESAVGHESTAQIISELLDIQCPVNRTNYVQRPNDIAIVFKLNERPPEGKILKKEEIEEIGFEFGLLKREE